MYMYIQCEGSGPGENGRPTWDNLSGRQLTAEAAALYPTSAGHRFIDEQ